jgi:hypothetical protein
MARKRKAGVRREGDREIRRDGDREITTYRGDYSFVRDLAGPGRQVVSFGNDKLDQIIWPERRFAVLRRLDDLLRKLDKLHRQGSTQHDDQRRQREAPHGELQRLVEELARHQLRPPAAAATEPAPTLSIKALVDELKAECQLAPGETVVSHAKRMAALARAKGRSVEPEPDLAARIRDRLYEERRTRK